MAHVRETILLAVKTALDTGPLVKKTFLTPVSTLNVDEYPAVVIRDLGDRMRRHVRLAYENTMSLELVLFNKELDPSSRVTEIHNLLAEVHAKVSANETWGGNATGTEMTEQTPDLGDAAEPHSHVRLRLEIEYRVKRDDATTVKVI